MRAAAALLALVLLPAAARGAPPDGEAALSRSLAALPEALVSAHHRASARWGMGMYETAAAGFTEILKSAPDQPAVLSDLAAVRLLQRRPEEAAALLDRALLIQPRSARLLYLRARAARARGRDAAAVKFLRAAAAVDRGEPAVLLGLAEALAAEGRTRDAETELRRLLAAAPENGPALFRLARLLDARGERAESARLLRRFSASDGRPSARACRYDAPIEPPSSDPGPGPGWVEVRAVRSHKGRPAVVTALSGRLLVRASAEDAPVRLRLGRRDALDALRVDWADGAHTYRLSVSTGTTVVIEEAAAHVW